MLTRRRKKMSKSEVRKATGRTFLQCATCELEEVEVSTDVTRVICATCVQKLVAPPPKPVVKSDKPRGWHLKPYFEQNGVVYSKGVEVTDEAEIKALRKQHTTAPEPEKSTPKKVAKKVTKKVAAKKVAKKVVAKKTKVSKGVKRARTTR